MTMLNRATPTSAGASRSPSARSTPPSPASIATARWWWRRSSRAPGGHRSRSPAETGLQTQHRRRGEPIAPEWDTRARLHGWQLPTVHRGVGSLL